MVEIKRDTNELVKTEAQSNFNKDQAIRHWAASHGGVYVPIDSLTPANQYLSHIKDRDIETKSGKKLTLMNPAYMIRQLNEYFTEYYGVVSHITSLKLLRPENKPDDWERNALEQFEKGITELCEYDTINGELYYRLIQPMIVTQNCLKCHAHQDYKVGDIRGSVAVSIPVKPYYKRELAREKQIILIFGLLWSIVSIILIIAYFNLKKLIKAKEKAEEQIRRKNIEIEKKNEELKIFNHNLESKVKERTKELRESEAKLRESNKTKDKFFSIIAHDLKSPFNTILGFSSILLERHKEYENSEKIIESLNTSAYRAFNLLEDLLTWSLSQSGRIEYSPEELYLKILLHETMFDIQGQAGKKNIKISDVILEGEIIYADKNMITTILRNLISNAIKFTPHSGQIILSSKKQASSNFIEISIKDTGVGIPKYKIDAIFNTDKDTSTKGTENEAGTGLGLILCKEFVEKHGGRIWAESEIDKGSTFYFTIPIN